MGLVISILERKIEEGMEEGGRWSMVHGFPESMEQLVEFERKVSITHVDGALLTLVGPKTKLHTASELLHEWKPSECGKPGIILWN